MKNPVTILLSAIALAAAGFFFIHDRKHHVQIISRVGQHSIDQGATIRVFESDNGLLNISYSIDGAQTKWQEGFIDPAESWFLYVHKRNELWLVNDQDVTLIFDFEKASGCYGLFNCHDSSVLNNFIYHRIPEELFSLLPEGVLRRSEDARSLGKVLETDDVFDQAAPKI